MSEILGIIMLSVMWRLVWYVGMFSIYWCNRSKLTHSTFFMKHMNHMGSKKLYDKIHFHVYTDTFALEHNEIPLKKKNQKNISACYEKNNKASMEQIWLRA